MRTGGAVIAETNEAIELSEGDYKPVIYFPRADIAMAFLEPSVHKTTCRHKGEASYFSIVTKSKVIDDVAWSNEKPNEALEPISKFIAFYRNNPVTIEKFNYTRAPELT